MHRTTIMLPRSLHERAGQKAAAHGWSLGQLIRQLLEQATREDDSGDPLFRDARTFSGPADLAAAHDELLYGDEVALVSRAGERAPPIEVAPTPRQRRRR